MSDLALSFLAATGLSFGVLLLLLRPAVPSKTARRRLGKIQDSIHVHTANMDGSELEKTAPWGHSVRLDALSDRYEIAKAVKLLLVHANSSLGLGGVVVLSAGAGLGCGVLCYVLLRLLSLAVAALCAGCMIPYWVLCFQSDRRLKAFNAALPDAIDLIARSLRAGHSMASSIEMVSQESPEPLAFEFVQVFQQQRLGLQFRDALLKMGMRVPSRDVQFLITAILVQKETGGDLTEILARASYVIRERVRIEGEVGTRTAQGRLTGWILGLLPIVMLVFINILSPGYSDMLFHDPLGQELLCAGAALIAVGAIVIRKIVDVQV
jgi:tight adherence protein B